MPVSSMPADTWPSCRNCWRAPMTYSPLNEDESRVIGSSHSSSTCGMWITPWNTCGQPSRPPKVASTASTTSGSDMIQCSCTWWCHVWWSPRNFPANVR